MSNSEVHETSACPPLTIQAILHVVKVIQVISYHKWLCGG